MAERYSSMSRILMEFVDNSLDDAESFYDADARAYRRAVTIDVHVSREGRRIRIVDNCRGMAPTTLSRVVMRVGESRKRGVSFVNGQFGFGMQSFRAACARLTVRSRSRSSAEGAEAGTSGETMDRREDAMPGAHQICIERTQSDGFELEAVGFDELYGSALLDGTGTEVTLEGFDAQWVDDSFAPLPVSPAVGPRTPAMLGPAPWTPTL